MSFAGFNPISGQLPVTGRLPTPGAVSRGPVHGTMVGSRGEILHNAPITTLEDVAIDDGFPGNTC